MNDSTQVPWQGTPNLQLEEPSRARSFRALGLVLSYPEQSWLVALEEISQALTVGTSGPLRAGLEALVTHLRFERLTALQEAYVASFDRTRSLSLHLFEHSHGDARERGQAMARLRQLYADQGWELDTAELPDYLPAICEFCSLAKPELRAALLHEALPILQRLTQRLQDKENPYWALLGRIVELATSGQATTGTTANDEIGSSPDEPALDDWDELDRQWEDSPVTFGVGAAHDSCNVQSDLIRPSRLARAGRDRAPTTRGGGLA